jgi:hypothetical protein
LKPSQSSGVVSDSKKPSALAASTFANSLWMNLSAVAPLFSESFSLSSSLPSGEAYELTTAFLSSRESSACTSLMYSLRAVISSSLSSALRMSDLLIR